MTIKQKPLSRRKSYKYFTSEVPENIDDFWKVAADGEVESYIKDDTFDFPESSVINDSGLKFKKEFDIKKADEPITVLEESSNEESFLSENKKEEISSINFENCIYFSNEINSLENKEIINKEIINDISFNNELSFNNESINYELINEIKDIKNKKVILNDKTNKEKKKSINKEIINIPNKIKKKEKSFLLKNKNDLLGIEDLKRYSFEKNKHLKIKKINKTEVALINLEKDSEIKEESCNRNMIVTGIKGCVRIEFNGNTFFIRNGGMCFIKSQCLFSMYGVSVYGSCISIVYVK